MYVTLKGKNDVGIETVEAHINKAINHDSRFTVRIDILSSKRLKLYDVRLREAKPYCGSHPNACDIDTGNRKAKWLEGADWVEFNDRINDVLDALNVSARVFSNVCELRDGRKRRINYSSFLVYNQYDWHKVGLDSDYVDYCGKIAPPSSYPFGTPGTYERNVDAAV